MTINLPYKADFTGPNVTEGGFKTAHDQLIDFLGQTLPIDGSPIPASTIQNTPAGNFTATDQQSVNANIDGKIGDSRGCKNLIINGEPITDQRNGGAAQNAIVGGTYMTDRWTFVSNVTPGKFNAQQNQGPVAPPPEFTAYQGLTVASAYTVGASDYFAVQQRIEGYNCRDLGWGSSNAKTLTLSFWVYCSLIGTYSGAISNAGNTRSYIFTYSIPVANTWTKISVTIPGDTAGTWLVTNGIGIALTFSMGMGSTFSTSTPNTWLSGNYEHATGTISLVGTSGAKFYYTGVQLERGKTVSNFEHLGFAETLNRCLRYYEVGGWVGFGTNLNSGGLALIKTDYKAIKRTTPTTTTNISYIVPGGTLRTGKLEGTSSQYIYGYGIAISNGNFDGSGSFTADAEL